MESSPSTTTTGISLTHLVSLFTIVNTPVNDPLSGGSVMKSIDHTEKTLSWGVNQLQQTSRSRGQVLLPLTIPAPTHKCRDLIWQAQPPNTAKQRRQNLVDTQVSTKCAMRPLQQKLAKSTTRWNHKKLWIGLSGVVIIHQSGTVDLVDNKSRVMGLSVSNNMLKLAGHTKGQV